MFEGFKILAITFIGSQIGYKIIVWIWTIWFSSTVYEYSNIDENYVRMPVIFEFKGKEIKLIVKREVTGNPICPYKELIIHIFQINDKSVMTLSELKGLWFTKRWIDMNMDYDTSDVFKILKQCRKVQSKRRIREIMENKKDRAIY